MIEITKTTPNDETTKKVLAEWFRAARPKWKQPADLCVGCFFLVTSVFFLSKSPIPPFAWLALAGAVVSFLVAFCYIPFLVSAAFKSNIRLPSYHKRKTYRFYDQYMVFSSEGAKDLEIPLQTFSQIRVTPDAALFLIGEKLALWFALDGVSKNDLEIILALAQNNNVKIVRTGN